jgi:hypothetical protein
MTFAFPEMNEQEQRRVEQEREEWASASGFRVTIEMNPKSIHGRDTIHLVALAQPLHGNRPPSFQGGQGTRLVLAAGPMSIHGRSFEDTAARDPDISRDPVFGSKKSFRPETRPRPNHLGVVPLWQVPAGHGMLRERLPDIARIYGVSILADAYRSGPRAGHRLPSQPLALYEVLDRLAGRDFRWERRANVVLVRSRTWFLERPQEIPLRFVRRWKESCDRYGLITFEEWLDAARALTDRQLQDVGEVKMEGGLPGDLWLPFAAVGPTLRLYIALTPPQRQALWEGRAVPVARMTPQQRGLFAETIRQSREGPRAPLPVERLAAGSVVMERNDFIRTYVSHGTGGRGTSEPVRPAGRTPGSTAAAPPLDRRITRGNMTRYPVTSLTFQFRIGEETVARSWLHVRTPR